MNYQEIILKYIQGGLEKNLKWLTSNLEGDPEVQTETSREKVNLLKLVRSMNDQLEEFLSDGSDDNRDNQELFSDDDIVVSPNSTPDNTAATTFLDDDSSSDEETEEDNLEDFDDGYDDN